MLAPTWQPVYLRRVSEVIESYQRPVTYTGPELGRWAYTWTSRKMLLYMHQRRHAARQPPEVWRAFERLYLPRWDKDFVRRCLWKKLPLGTRMERLGGKLCPLDNKVEDHEHVFRHCFFCNFMFDTVRRAFGLVESEQGRVEPSRLLRDHPLLSLTSTQGLILWAGSKVQWGLRCRAKYQRVAPVLDEFIAGWAGLLRAWRAEKDMSCSRRDLCRFVEILDGWFVNPHMPRIFPAQPQQPTNAKPVKQRDKLQEKEEKWGKYRDAEVQRLQALAADGWTVAYSDGSAKTVRGWAQAGYGVWYARGSSRDCAAHVPVGERQSVSRGELRGVLHALLHRSPGERLVVVLDSEYVYKGIVEWSPKWRRHEWRTTGREVGHRDLWETILWERERAGEQVQLRWIPSHLGVQGNEEADALAEAGRGLHPHNEESFPKRVRVEPQWEALGLEEMASGGEATDSDMASSGESGGTLSSGSEGVSLSDLESDEFSTDVSDRARDRALGVESEMDSESVDSLEAGSGGSEFSTDVSDSRKRRRFQSVHT